jgi:hypothetical protein
MGTRFDEDNYKHWKDTFYFHSLKSKSHLLEVKN